MVTFEQVISGALAFAENELLPVMNGMQLWSAAFGLGVIRGQIGAISETVKNNHYINMLGLANEKGELDIDPAIASAKDTVKRYGKMDLTIPVVGTFRLGEADFDKLAEYIRGSAVTPTEVRQ